MEQGKENNSIEIRDLTIEFELAMGNLCAVNHADFDIPEGKVTALVGESGSGKSTLASAILNIVSVPGRISSGQILYKKQDVLTLGKEELQKFRWSDVSMVFQAAQNSLNPVMTIEEQMIETVKAHIDEMPDEKILEKAKTLLEHVRLEPERILSAYPHELSGGMKQRVMIAFSLLLDPKLIVLDEPTTALDVITQAYIFDILIELHKKLGITMLLLTHDIAVVAKVADRVGVMYAGSVVEVGDIVEVFKKPAHPYTVQLLKAVPSLVDKVKQYTPVTGTALDLFNLPSGCAFRTRCPYAEEICAIKRPAAYWLHEEHYVSCYRYMSKAQLDNRKEEE